MVAGWSSLMFSALRRSDLLDPDKLLGLFADCSDQIRRAVEPIHGADRRARTDRDGQYGIDLIADEVALGILHRAPVRVLSEESGWSGPQDSEITVVLDPIDGSTNCARHLPYWACSLAAVDAQGVLASLVVNQATGVTTTAIRGEGAWRDGLPIISSSATKIESAVVHLSGLPGSPLPWRQFRAMGSAALALCDVAAGSVDAMMDAGPWHAPWDYLGGLLACIEAGAQIGDASGLPLVALDFNARRQIIAAGTLELFETISQATSNPA